MTVQRQEQIEYKNENYKLFGAPFEPFLEKHKHIKFDWESTDNRSGYLSFWKIENGKLYLSNLLSSNYNMQDIFKTDEPVFAEWFTGVLQCGFGEYQSNHWWGSYENYLWFKFEKGVIIDKRIEKGFDKDNYVQYMEFGKYKYQKVSDLLYGKITQSEKSTIKSYITAVIEYISGKSFEKIVIPKYKFAYTDLELIDKLKTIDIDFKMSDNNLKIVSQKKEIAIQVSSLLEKILSLIFVSLNEEYKEIVDEQYNINFDTILLNPDYRFLNWALKTVDRFNYPPQFLIHNFNLTKLVGFKINRASEFEFNFQPLTIQESYTFPPATLAINRKKFEKAFFVYYDEKYNKVFYNMAVKSNLMKFQYFLDEGINEKPDEQ